MVVWGTSVESVLKLKSIGPDVEYDRLLDSEINWIHRKSGDTDIYFIVNSSDKQIDIRMSFRVTGREAEIWDPADGSIIKSAYTTSGRRTVVPLNLPERQSAFIIFRGKTGVMSAENPIIPSPAMTTELTGPWVIKFPPELGAPGELTLDSLKSWTLNSDAGVKFFSGTAVYTKTFDAQKYFIQQGTRFVLDLGRVGDIAEVKVNGLPAGLLWKPPYTTDITRMLIRGNNTIEIKVTNEWTNRIAGDRVTGTKVLNSSLFVRPGTLSESGLIGPVKILKYIK
jgi:hypothetical protein